MKSLESGPKNNQQLAVANSVTEKIDQLVNFLKDVPALGDPATAKNPLLEKQRNEEILQKLSNEIRMVESSISIEKATYNPALTNFDKVVKTGQRQYIVAVSRIITNFLTLNNISWADRQVYTCAMDIMDLCPTWNVADMVCFMRFIRQNPKQLKELRIYQNFTPADLLRMVPFYNEEQAIVVENKKRAEIHEENLPATILTVKGKDGTIKKYPIGEAYKRFAEKLSITPVNKIQKAMQKALIDHDVKKQTEEEAKPQWKKDKEKAELNKKISEGANNLGKDKDDKKSKTK